MDRLDRSNLLLEEEEVSLVGNDDLVGPALVVELVERYSEYFIEDVFWKVTGRQTCNFCPNSISDSPLQLQLSRKFV